MNRHKLLILLTTLLAIGFITTSLVSYQVSKHAIHNAIIESELPLTADNIYSEIQKDMVRTVFIASMMASDTFLRDWLLEGEPGLERISKYLSEVRKRYGAFSSFLVSEKSRNYYYSDGILKQVKLEEPRDDWYFRVRQLQQPYELNVDRDLAHADALTIFVNYRVLDYDDHYLGATGVGLTVDSVQQLIDGYRKRYHRNVYFFDSAGRVVLSSGKLQPPGTAIQDIEGLSALYPEILKHEVGSYAYQNAHGNFLVNSRFIPELKWYLFVEKSESEATSDIRTTLYLNLLLCLLVTVIVIGLIYLALRRYQAQVEALATTDMLTGLPNRRAFEIVVEVLFSESMRNKTPIAIIMLDIDHFKQINDVYGHLAGDYVLSEVALTIRSCLRASDFVCRWGGEEFLIVIKDSDAESVMRLAEKVRLTLSDKAIAYKNQHIRITASLGAGLAQAHKQETIVQLIERADHAMYQAKSAGRNQVMLSTESQAVGAMRV